MIHCLAAVPSRSRSQFWSRSLPCGRHFLFPHIQHWLDSSRHPPDLVSFNLPSVTIVLLPRFISKLISAPGLDALESLSREAPRQTRYSRADLLGQHGQCHVRARWMQPESCVFPSSLQDKQLPFLNTRALAVVMQHFYASSVLRCRGAAGRTTALPWGYLRGNVGRDHAGYHVAGELYCLVQPCSIQSTAQSGYLAIFAVPDCRASAWASPRPSPLESDSRYHSSHFNGKYTVPVTMSCPACAVRARPLPSGPRRAVVPKEPRAVAGGPAHPS